MIRIGTYIVCIGMLILGSSCSSGRNVVVENESVRIDTIRMIRSDSIIAHDSVVVELRGDTVFKTAWRERYRFVTDTILRVRTDSVKIEVPVIIEGELDWWDKFKLQFTGLIVGLMLLLILVYFFHKK